MIVTLNVAVVAHWPDDPPIVFPAVGVNVYNVVPAFEVLIAAFQLPVIAGLLVELVGNVGATEF